MGALALALVAILPVSAKGLPGKPAPAKVGTANVDSLAATLSKRAVCTLLLNSELQNAHYEQEAEAADASKSTLLALTSTIAKGGAESSTAALFAMPAALFPTIVLPERFVDLQLDEHVISYDSIRTGVTAEEAALYNPKTTGQALGDIAKSTATTAARGLSSATKSLKKGAKKMAGAALDAATDAIGITDEVRAVTETTTSLVSTTKSTVNALTGKKEQQEQKSNVADAVAESKLLYTDEVDEYANAVIHNYLTERHVAAQLVSRWFDYTPDSLARWSTTPAWIDAADSVVVADSSLMADTYVVVTNLRLRSLQAIRQEVAAVAKSAGSTFGVVGKLAVGAASTASAAVIGDGYAVQAISYLYKLRWDDELDSRFRTSIVEANGSLDDLIASGLCMLDYVGREKATVNILQSVVSSQTADAAVRSAIERAVDESVAKLF